jgi:hypothetical protein
MTPLMNGNKHGVRHLFTILRMTLFGAALAALAIACGGGSSNREPAKSPEDFGPAPELAIKLVVEASSEEGKAFVTEVTSSLTSVLSKAGYTLVTDDKTAQVQAKVLVGAAEKQAVFQTTINGQRQVTYNVKVDASFLALGDSSLIDQAVAEFTADAGKVDQPAIETLVAQLGERGKLKRYAARLDQNKKDAAQALKDEEDKMWKAANVDDCRGATSEKACEGVDAYLAKYPSGAYAADGRKAIEDSKASADKRSEEDLWAKADAEKCKSPTKVEDCQGLQQYLDKYPAGSHADEAKGTLKSVAAKLDALNKKAEAEAKAADKKECINECKRRFIHYAPGAYDVLVGRCIQADC